MNPEQVAKLLLVITAFAERKTVECRNSLGEWVEVFDLQLDSEPENYRIKPEPIERWIVRRKDGVGSEHLHPSLESASSALAYINERDRDAGREIVHLREVTKH